MTVAVPVEVDGKVRTKPSPSPSILTPSTTSLNRNSIQLSGSSRAVCSPPATSERSHVNRYSRYAIPSSSKGKPSGTATFPFSSSSCAPAVGAARGLVVCCSSESLTTNVVAMTTESHCDSVGGVLPSTLAGHRPGELPTRAQQTSADIGNINCSTPLNCPTPANCPAPVKYHAPVGAPPRKCRHSNAVEYLVSALCPGQHWKAREVVVQCLRLQCQAGRGTRGHGRLA